VNSRHVSVFGACEKSLNETPLVPFAVELVLSDGAQTGLDETAVLEVGDGTTDDNDDIIEVVLVGEEGCWPLRVHIDALPLHAILS